jgi:dTDP-4-amino-4,6-dideoxygalactose transaminase
MTAVPFVDFSSMHAGLRDDFLAQAADLVDTGAFTNGPQVATFEAAFADYCRARHCVGVASGLDALRLGLIAAGVGPGDEVIVPAHTFVATAEAVSQAGATPVFADVDETACLDPAAAEAAITPRTKAILAVHLYGQLADMRALGDVAERHGLQLHEDAAQAHGAERDGIRAGELGLTAGFSFYPGKNLGAFGDAGALTTTDPEIAERVVWLREHGQRAKYDHAIEGWTSRLDTLQAIVLALKLRRLDEWNVQRRAAAARYDECLTDVELPVVATESDPVWHLYAVRTPNPDVLASHLREHGIATGRHYPVPLHLTGAYARLGYAEGEFPCAERWAAQELSLPIFPGITDEQIHRVAAAIGAYRPAAAA